MKIKIKNNIYIDVKSFVFRKNKSNLKNKYYFIEKCRNKQ